MNINKLFMGVAGVAFLAANIAVVGCAVAAEVNRNAANNATKSVSATDPIKEQAVLFKIHDIVPFKNGDGEVVGCDYKTTFYNRSDVVIGSATLNLEWKDQAIDEVIDQEKKEDAKKNEKPAGRASSTTERLTDKTVTALVDVPSINPLRQAVVQSRVNTDRCFLLIDDPKFEVKNCSSGAVKTAGNRGNGSRSDVGCAKLFHFVSAEDPQYYLEFKAITADQEKEEKEAKQIKEKSETDGLYEKTLKSIEMTDAVISTIK